MMVKQSKLLKPLKYGVFFLFLVILSSIAVSAAADWPQSGKWDFKAGYQDTTYFSTWNGTSTYSEIALGVDMQPIVSDWDNDGIMELIFSNNQVLYIYTLNNLGGLTLENSFNMGATQDAPGYMFDNISNKFLIIPFGTTLYSLRYNGSALDKTINSTITSSTTSGVTCIKLGGGQACYMEVGAKNITEYNPLTGLGLEHNFSAYNFNGNYILGQSKHSLDMADIDQDGDYEIMVPCNVAIGNAGLCVIDRATMAMKTTFSGDGYVGIINVGSFVAGYYLGYPVSWNFIQGFGLETCMSSLNTGTGGGSSIYCFDYTGTSVGGGSLAPGGSNVATTDIVIADINTSNSGFEVCGGVTTFSCFNGWEGTFVSAITPFNIGAVQQYPYTSADMNHDGKSEILFNNSFYTSTGGRTSISSNINQLSNMVAVDMNGDSILDVCGQYTGETFCATTNVAVNAIPTLTNGLTRSYGNPVCNGTTLRYSAKEYSYSTGRTTDNDDYYNDGVVDQEFLVADCYGNGSLTNGSLSLSAPTVDCVYNAPGTYYAKVYLLDNHNLGDFTQYKNIVVQVISGVSGSTCDSTTNVIENPSAPIVTTLATPSDVTNSWTTLFSWLTGGNTSAKLLIGFILLMFVMVGTAVGLARLGVNGSALSILALLASGIGFIILTMIGLFPVWILVLLLLVLSLITALVLALKARSGV
jgi:hypothetical protein